jgi:hypothetical protein
MTTWVEVTEARYDEMLGMLPPAIMTGVGFLVGEPMDHNAQGQPRFSAFAHVNYERFFEAKEVLTIAEFRAIKIADFLEEIAP